MTGQNRIMIFGSKDDGSYVVEYGDRQCAILLGAGWSLAPTAWDWLQSLRQATSNCCRRLLL